jgi:uncharacterized phosphosugar-binding protein
MSESQDADALCGLYFDRVTGHMRRILDEEKQSLDAAADKLADQIAADRLIHVYGPGGHSNLAAQEIFFRAGGLMHVSAILDEGTLLSNGALRSMAIERPPGPRGWWASAPTPGYGKVVIADQKLGEGDLLLLTNAYGINAALIDAALEARSRGVFVIGVSSREHAERTRPEHPARHPTKKNLHAVVDLAIDTKVPVGDALVEIEGMEERIAAVSTFANAFALNCLIIRTVAKLVERGIEPPIWRSGNAPGGDEANGRFIARFRDRVRWL